MTPHDDFPYVVSGHSFYRVNDGPVARVAFVLTIRSDSACLRLGDGDDPMAAIAPEVAEWISDLGRRLRLAASAPPLGPGGCR